MMDVGIFARTFPGRNVDEVCRHIAQSGFQTVHWNMACAGLPILPNSVPISIIRNIQRALQKYRLTVCGISATYNMCHPDPTLRQDGLKKLSVIARLCDPLQTKLVTLCTGSRDPTDKWAFHPDNNSIESWQILLDHMEKALEVAELYSIQLGIEPELGNIVNSIDKANRLLNFFQSPRLKVVLDPANLFEYASSAEIKRIIDDALAVLGPNILIAHAKDRDANGQFVAPGRGIIPFAYFKDQLIAKTNCRTMVAHGLSADEAEEVFKFLSSTPRDNF